MNARALDLVDAVTFRYQYHMPNGGEVRIRWLLERWKACSAAATAGEVDEVLEWQSAFLGARDSIETILRYLPAFLSEQLMPVVAALDSEFIAVTTPFFGTGDHEDWWHHRLPVQMNDSLAADVRRYPAQEEPHPGSEPRTTVPPRDAPPLTNDRYSFPQAALMEARRIGALWPYAWDMDLPALVSGWERFADAVEDGRVEFAELLRWYLRRQLLEEVAGSSAAHSMGRSLIDALMPADDHFEQVTVVAPKPVLWNSGSWSHRAPSAPNETLHGELELYELLPE